MTEPTEPSTPEERIAAETRRGVVIGILVVVLIALAAFFFWRGTGARDATGHTPPAPARGAVP